LYEEESVRNQVKRAKTNKKYENFLGMCFLFPNTFSFYKKKTCTKRKIFKFYFFGNAFFLNKGL
ncbi:MAG: hypothetical protein KAT65_02720, partial [Methanophagales archaeon]|nr:hypothetical protein [Methanophagales archaeon]